MKKMIPLCLLLLAPYHAFAKEKVIWTAVFDDIQPRSAKVSKAYCKAHAPTVMVTTVEQVLSKSGVKTINGLRVQYLSYKSEKKDGFLFNVVNAVIRGRDKQGSWSAPVKMYQQTLSEQDKGKTWVVWSTPQCKGSFIGTPTVVNEE